MKNKFVLVIASSAFILSSCSQFMPDPNYPMHKHDINSTSDKDTISIVATDAAYRVTIANLINGTVCVEPPPEAVKNVDKAFAALFKANVNDKGEISSNIASAFSSTADKLFQRSQTVQLFRDSVFATCTTAANGTLAIPKKIEIEIDNALNKLASEAKLTLTKNTIDYESFVQLKNKINAENISSNQESKKKNEFLKKIESKFLQKAYEKKIENLVQHAYATLITEFPHFYKTERLKAVVKLIEPRKNCKKDADSSVDGGTVNANLDCSYEVPKINKDVLEVLMKGVNDTL